MNTKRLLIEIYIPTIILSVAYVLLGQAKLPIWQVLIISCVFVGIAGLASAWIAPLENLLFDGIRAEVLSRLPIGFDWTDNGGTVFRGYLTSHYKNQGWCTPILITILFSLYHFWLPFNNVFRILVFAPVAYVAYKKKNFYIAIVFHCLCNLFSVIGFIAAIW